MLKRPYVERDHDQDINELLAWGEQQGVITTKQHRRLLGEFSARLERREKQFNLDQAHQMFS